MLVRERCSHRDQAWKATASTFSKNTNFRKVCKSLSTYFGTSLRHATFRVCSRFRRVSLVSLTHDLQLSAPAAAPELNTAPEPEPERETLVFPPAAAEPQPGKGLAARFRIAAFVASSALLGGIAVVVWHRRVLEQMRQGGPKHPPRTGTDEFI